MMEVESLRTDCISVLEKVTNCLQMLTHHGKLLLEDQQIKGLGTQEMSKLWQAVVVSTIPLQTGTFCSKDSADHSCANSGRRKAFSEGRIYVFRWSSFIRNREEDQDR